MTATTGLRLDVYRDADGSDCTANGISARNARLTLVGVKRDLGPVEPLPRTSQVFSPTDAAPAVILVARGRGAATYFSIAPLADDGADIRKGGMAGGNFASTSDSRFNDLVADLRGDGGRYIGAVAIHDRFEW